MPRVTPVLPTSIGWKQDVLFSEFILGTYTQKKAFLF